jgi:hypothetical protein
MPSKFFRAKRLPAKTKFLPIAADGPLLPSPDDMSEEELRAAIFNGPAFVSWFKDVKEYVIGGLASGDPVSGLKLVDGPRLRRFDMEREAQIVAAIRAKGRSPYRLIGVSEAEAILGDKLTDSFTIRECSYQLVVPESDKRPAAKPQSRYLSDGPEGES